jgi:hypothetical protein
MLKPALWLQYGLRYFLNPQKYLWVLWFFIECFEENFRTPRVASDIGIDRSFPSFYAAWSLVDESVFVNRHLLCL